MFTVFKEVQMTSLEFVSHMHHSRWIKVLNMGDYSSVNCKVGEFEGEEYSKWHGMNVVDWSMDQLGKIYLEVQDV